MLKGGIIMKRRFLFLFTFTFLLLCLTGCSATAEPGYTQIDQETAKQMMEKDDGHVVVDVRRQDEYEAGHIPGAILIPNENIGCDSPEALPDYDQIILIYCRSGNRSKQAAKKLAGMGYTRIYEFGGINTWTGEIVTTENDIDPMFEGFTDFYYTYDTSTQPPHYQRYRFYVEDGEYFFYHETREGGDWPQTEEDITASGTVKMSEEGWKTFISCLEGGTIKEPEISDEDGDAGPWTYIYRGNGQEEYEFPSYAARLAFEEYCEGLCGMKIKVTDGEHTVIYLLNNSSSAKSLYSMLPLEIEVENYGSNEKIFYPKETIYTTDGIEGGGEAGALALFSPWGNVVMYYDSFGSYPGLYILGEAVEGVDQIRNLSGTIRVEAETAVIARSARANEG